jgi:hypothetical protein
MYQIESNIPLPDGASGAPTARYPLYVMQRGDSFFVPSDGSMVKTKSRVTAAVSQFHRRNKESGERFTVRQVANGVRVWRTA